MNYSKEELYALSIYEVRKIGQLEGVKSPTSMKKDELIDEIIAISSGVKDRYVPTSKKGRPSKAFKEFDFLRNFEDKKEEQKKSFFDSTFEVCAPSLDDEAIYKMATEKDGEVEGYVDILSGGFGIVKESLNGDDSFVFLTASLIKKASLKKGDKIKVSVLKLGNGKRFADEIISKAKNADRPDFMNLEAIYPSKKINFENSGILNKLSPIGCGQRVEIVCDDENLQENVIFNLFNKTNLDKFLIVLGAQPEEKQKYKNNKQIICIENENDITSAVLATNVLHRKAEEGKDCIVFVVGGNSLNFNFDKNELLKDLSRAFKNTKEEGSVTLIVGTEKANQNSFAKFCNLSIVLDEKLYLFGIDFPIDVNSISLFRKDDLLDGENKELIKKAKLLKLSSDAELVNFLNTL